MKRWRLFPAAAVLMTTAVQTAGSAQVRPAPAVAGIVLEDGAPAACARVMLQGAGQMLSMRTGIDGRFEFSKVPFRGRWLGVEGDSPWNMVTDAKRFPDLSKVVLRSHADRLLAGLLLDERHQPIENVEVTAFRRQTQYGRLRFVPVANDVTEADGTYCIKVPVHQSDSEFLVGVIPTGTWLARPTWAQQIAALAGHPPTFFPSVTGSSAAKVLTVRRGEARRGLNFSLQSGRVTRIEGDVLNPDVLALSASDLVLEPPDEDVAIHRRATPDAAGHFIIDDVPPGSYTLRMFPIARPEGGGRWGVAHVTVRGQATMHVSVSSRPTQTFAGTARFAGQPSMLPGVPLFFTVNAARVLEPSDRFPSSFYPSAFSSLVDADGGFALKNLVPGKYRLSISGASDRGWRLDSITMPVIGEDGGVDTRDVTESPLIVAEGIDTFGAKVQLSPQLPQILGVVQDERGKPIASRVIVFPADDRTWPAWTRSGRAMAEHQTRLDGTFTVAGLPAGDYFVAAVPDTAPVGVALFGALRPLAARLTIAESVAVHVTLTRLAWTSRGAGGHPDASKR